MNFQLINQMEDPRSAFFEWWNEWATVGDRMECISDDDITGEKTYAVYDVTGQEKCKFNTEVGIISAYVGEAQPVK